MPAELPEGLDSDHLREVLHFLAELGQVVASNTQLQPILDWVVGRTTRLLAADEGCLRLVAEGARTSDTLFRPEPQQLVSGSWPRPLALSVTGQVLASERPLATPDVLADERFPGLRGLDTRIRALLAVPLRVENRITGLLAVTQRAPGRLWTEDEVELLSIVAASSSGVLEQARLRVEAVEKRRLEEEARRIEKELEQARAAQMQIVPGRPLRVGAWEVTGRVVPARHVGGDSFDYFPLGERRLGLAIGDVAGKGLPAALLMMTTQSYLRVFCAGDRPVAEKLRLLNRSVARSARPGKFVTLFYGELDADAGTLRYVNAGHNYPLLRRADGGIEPLVTGGLMLGFAEDQEFAEGEAGLEPGDALLLYSDGVSEAMDASRQEYGEERLREVWCRHGSLPPAEGIERILADVERFRGGAPPSDDVTLVVLAAARA